jgi:hypothetical protein
MTTLMPMKHLMTLLLWASFATVALAKDVPEDEFRRQGGGLAHIASTFKPERVRALLGAPYSLVPVEEIKGVMWSYRPFPFSFEFVGDQVYSIRVSRTYQ